MCDGRGDIRCDEEHCDLAGPGQVGNPNQCRICWLRLGNTPGIKADAIPPEPKPLLLGDAVEVALSKVGITKERVSEWLGAECACSKRQAKLNKLDQWARRAATESVEAARGWLKAFLGL